MNTAVFLLFERFIVVCFLNSIRRNGIEKKVLHHSWNFQILRRWQAPKHCTISELKSTLNFEVYKSARLYTN